MTASQVLGDDHAAGELTLGNDQTIGNPYAGPLSGSGLAAGSALTVALAAGVTYAAVVAASINGSGGSSPGRGVTPIEQQL